MTKQRRSVESEYRRARIASGMLLVAMVAFMVVFDAISTTFEVSPLVLVPILIVAAAMFAVDVPYLGRSQYTGGEPTLTPRPQTADDDEPREHDK